MFMDKSDLVTVTEAAKAMGKTVANIRYYITYNRVGKYKPNGKRLENKAKNGELRVSLSELRGFLHLVDKGLQNHHHAGLNAELGFYYLPEYKRTKHIHRLHPYLGKFIPQLVEYFLDSHTDDFKKNTVHVKMIQR